MKKTLLLSILTVGILTGYNANAKEEHMPPKPHHEMNKKDHKAHEAKLAKELLLTEEQREEFKKIRDKSKGKMKKLMDEMKELREEMDEIRKDDREDFEKVLTPEQKKKFEKMKDKKKKHKKSKKPEAKK